jgi:hypothetical protein
MVISVFREHPLLRGLRVAAADGFGKVPEIAAGLRDERQIAGRAVAGMKGSAPGPFAKASSSSSRISQASRRRSRR